MFEGPWISIVVPDADSATSLQDAFDSSWGERGIGVDLPDHFDFSVQTRMPNKSLDKALSTVRRWLMSTGRESIVVISGENQHIVSVSGAPPRATQPGDGGESLPPKGRHLIASFKVEEDADNGERAGPLTVWDPGLEAVAWQSADWLSESAVLTLCETYGWQLEIDA